VFTHCARFCSFFFYNIYNSLYDLNIYYYLLSGSQSNSRIDYKRTCVYKATTDIYDRQNHVIYVAYTCICMLHARYIITNSAHCRALYLNMYHVNRTFTQKF